ncbi:S-adenosyl-L-methionine-dependent methyltransferase [Podospora aff. communis PSN243]|uniref:S-adenosyl-L-methionine-dependent methyltransferase n=1 Tax=Podospora aff. communis PSN243 TaxID=3040156 RepID=A0AAV9GE11_9PEZI|nr:S-adenosyl-L-methionine-dependent methyltransferase [Podospora aff. communis PSN243]
MTTADTMDIDIEVAPLSDDYESGGGSDAESSTASISSSILEYRALHGRTFHSARHQTDYYAPNDDQAKESIDLSHHYLTLLCGGKLFLAPIPDDVKEVLDVGTGTGIWAIDFADQYPDAKVIGTDLSPMQPTWTPSNMSFEIDDATQPWTWDKDRFDFVHMRYLMGSIRDYTTLFSEAFAHTKPGGWIQSAEIDSDFRSDDGTTNIPVLQKWNQFFDEAGKATGAVFSVIADDLQRKGLAAAGYTDIESKTFKVPMGGWARDPHLAEIGRIISAALDNDLEGYTLFLWHEVLKWPKEEYRPWIEAMRKALRNRRIHGYMLVRFVWARKPES